MVSHKFRELRPHSGRNEVPSPADRYIPLVEVYFRSSYCELSNNPDQVDNLPVLYMSSGNFRVRQVLDVPQRLSVDSCHSRQFEFDLETEDGAGAGIDDVPKWIGSFFISTAHHIIPRRQDFDANEYFDLKRLRRIIADKDAVIDHQFHGAGGHI
jgi:hypothetical protein